MGVADGGGMKARREVPVGFGAETLSSSLITNHHHYSTSFDSDQDSEVGTLTAIAPGDRHEG